MFPGVNPRKMQHMMKKMGIQQQEIDAYEAVKVISHEKNLGYGAALKTGFASTSGDLIGFLDGDGTCDPMYFIGLINEIERENADIAVASRMGLGSKMPKIRRLGNKIFVHNL